MNEFKSKTNISQKLILCNPYESKASPVFPVSESLTFLPLNERIQIENEYFWLSNPYETKARYSLSCV